MAELTAIAVTLSPLVGDLLQQLLSTRLPLALLARFTDIDSAERWLAANTADLIMASALDEDRRRLVGRLQVVAPASTWLILSADGQRAWAQAPGAAEVELAQPSADQLMRAVLETVPERAARQDDLNP